MALNLSPITLSQTENNDFSNNKYFSLKQNNQITFVCLRGIISKADQILLLPSPRF